MSDLYSRLRAIRDRKDSPRTPRNPHTPHTPNSASAASAEPLPGPDWTLVAPGVYQRETVYSFSTPHDLRALQWVFGAGFSEPVHALRIPAGHDPLFIDIETTGLSGGSGNVAFLVGVGRLEDDDGDAGPSSQRDTAGNPPASAQHHSAPRVRVTQLFLSDFGSEGGLVTALDELIRVQPGAPPPLYVTYNGGSFDLPVLRTRYIMNRRRFPEAPHVDLLHPVRRLFAPVIGSCSLGAVESRVLHLTRTEDVPSAEVPLRYLAFLNDGDADPMKGVFSHHAQDIAHLAVLSAYLTELVSISTEGGARGTEGESDSSLQPRADATPQVPSQPGTTVRTPPDKLGLARLILARGGPGSEDRAVELLDELIAETEARRVEIARFVTSGRLRALRAARGGRERNEVMRSPVSDRWARSRDLRAILARRRGETNTLVALREELADTRGTPADLVALAIVCEHALRDPARAIAVLQPLEDSSQEIAHRRARLEAKLARQHTR